MDHKRQSLLSSSNHWLSHCYSSIRSNLALYIGFLNFYLIFTSNWRLERGFILESRSRQIHIYMASFASESTAVEDFVGNKHADYIVRVSEDKESLEYTVTEYLRMSGIYWGLTAMCVLGKDISSTMKSAEIVEWVMACYHPESGGFGASIDHDEHMLYTLSAIQILAICGQLERLDKVKVASYIASRQLDDGSFTGDQWGEVDTRFSYCGLAGLAILGLLDSGLINLTKACDFIARCRNFDGGFGAVPGAESHAGQIFCCVGALSIGRALHHVDAKLLGWWLSERQCDSGGLNGRPEKQADVCYSWWILSSLAILGKTHWIDQAKLREFILACQDPQEGGIGDRPGNMTDIFHTFFGISGLSLLGCFADGSLHSGSREIDPTYALPRDLVTSLGLPAQVL